ncbi:MAG: hypothetical protein ACRD72_01955 [Candidatus Angelobacter sp.]|jgi:hypothetical protein
MMIPFKYFEFWDVPRVIMISYHDQDFLLESYFDEAIDDYPDDYAITLVAPGLEQRIRESSWTVLAEIERRPLGTIPVREVVFDETRRKYLDPVFLDKYFPNR